MQVFKRKGSDNWYYKFEVSGNSVYKSTGTQDEDKAKEIAAKHYATMFDQVKLGVKQRYLWQEAVVKFVNESDKRSKETERYHLIWLSKHLDGVYLDQIDSNFIERIIAAKLKEAGTTRCNRTTGVISAILNKAVKQWGWLDKTPYIRKFKEPRTRLRWFTQDEAKRLLAELPPHSAYMARFALATGLREMNVTLLEWPQINLQSKILWIHGDQSKNGKVIRVPLNEDAIAVLRAQIGKHPTRVFTYKGNPVEHVMTKAYRAALKRAGIEGACFHTWRHTWASWHVQNGTPLQVLKELGGWSSLEIVQRYAHLAPEHLAEYASNVLLEKTKSLQLKTVRS